MGPCSKYSEFADMEKFHTGAGRKVSHFRLSTNRTTQGSHSGREVNTTSYSVSFASIVVVLMVVLTGVLVLLCHYQGKGGIEWPNTWRHPHQLSQDSNVPGWCQAQVTATRIRVTGARGQLRGSFSLPFTPYCSFTRMDLLSTGAASYV